MLCEIGKSRIIKREWRGILIKDEWFINVGLKEVKII